jgi:hypothetical protein
LSCFTRKRVEEPNQMLWEKHVAHIWQQQVMSRLVTDTGQKIQVIFPGKTCNDGGCDFQDAVLDINGRIIIGKIEVHVLSSQWYSHRHHLDGNYPLDKR